MYRYGIMNDDREIGVASVTCEGLYYRFDCSCIKPAKGTFRLAVQSENSRTDLGIGIPDGDVLVWRTRIAIKHIGSGELRFFVSAGKTDRRFVAIDPQKPFEAIECLEGAKFTMEAGVPGLSVPLPTA